MSPLQIGSWLIFVAIGAAAGFLVGYAQAGHEHTEKKRDR